MYDNFFNIKIYNWECVSKGRWHPPIHPLHAIAIETPPTGSRGQITLKLNTMSTITDDEREMALYIDVATYEEAIANECEITDDMYILRVPDEDELPF